jgi:hypothetical protein
MLIIHGSNFSGFVLFVFSVVKTFPALSSVVMKHPSDHPEFAFAPRVHIPVICIPQPDGGVLVRPGKPVVMGAELRVAEFARHTGLSVSRVEALCQEGKISSRRLSPNPKSPYVIPREELERYMSIRKIQS